MIIAIDGPAGSGKSTTAQNVAQKLGFVHINTGAMYRAIALKIIRRKIKLNDKIKIKEILHNTNLDFIESNIYMDGENVSTEILSPIVTEDVSAVSAILEVREEMVRYQRKMSIGNNVVLEGRDIGTVVFPDADFKFYIVADIEVRAERRKRELDAMGNHLSLEDISSFLINRDKKDSSRECSPLMKAKDAIEIDTTDLNIKEQVNCIVDIINKNKKGA